jgi:uncharacterized protein (TIGR03086 family)
MDDIDLLSAVMAKAADLVDTVSPDQLDRPTPCSDWDVRGLLEHMVGWIRVFDVAANGDAYDGDPADYRLTDDYAARFRRSAESLVGGWREHGLDRTVRLTSGEMPAPTVFNMTLMEYVTHGWDLATAIGVPAPFTEDEAEATLERARQTLQPQYRGDAIGAEVAAPDDAAATTRLAAFMGRAI